MSTRHVTSMTELKNVFLSLFWDYFLRVSTLSQTSDLEMVKELEQTSVIKFSELPILTVFLEFLDQELFYQFFSAVEVFIINDDSQLIRFLEANSGTKKMSFHFSFHFFTIIQMLLERKQK